MTKCYSFLAALALAGGFSASAAFSTAGNHGVYTFESLSLTDGSGVTKVGDAFVVAADIEIAATDTLRLLGNEELRLANDVMIKVLGYADFKAASHATITRNDDADAPQGIYLFNADACGHFENVTFNYASLRTFGNTKGITVRNCVFNENNTRLTSTGAISLGSTNAGNIIEGCTFSRTESGAIGGSANGYAGIIVKGCSFFECNTGNSNRPVINLTVGGDNEVVIENNRIYGGRFSMVGGIGVSNMLAASAANVVKVNGNYVDNCRYGFTSIGPMAVEINNNTLINNHYEVNAMNGGSGMSLYDPYRLQTVTASGNHIEGSLWGITVIGCGNVNLGKTDDPAAADYNPGLNVFVNNGNGGVIYDLYNNSTNTIYAQGNTWNVSVQSLEEIAKVITDKSDVASLGEVIYDPAASSAVVRCAPRAVKAVPSFDAVTLSWQAPTAPIELKWHDGEDYNGHDGVVTDPQGPQQMIMAARFSPEELKDASCMVVDSIDYFEYRDFAEAYAQIYENGRLVRNQPIDLSGFVKNSWRSTKLDVPYVISGNDEVMFAISYKAGSNQSFTAITDRSATRGKGNLVSYDNGATWHADGPGDFLITAHLRNIANAEPVGYRVSVDGNVVSSAVAGTSFTVEKNADGEHIYRVDAVFADDFMRFSEPVAATTKAVTNLLPAPATIAGTVDNGLNGSISWQAPLKRGEQLTWSNLSLATSIGATASSPKVWVKQEFEAGDLIAYPDHQITAVNAFFVDNAPTAVTLFVMKDGAIAYSQALTADEVAAITPNAWNKFSLAEPFVLVPGSKYAFGYYCTHAKGLKPIGVDSSEAINLKGNVFSTSSPSSKGFDQSNPSWKTLASGDIAGNFMLSADVEALSEVPAADDVTGYSVYADGQLVADNLTETSFSETVDQLGDKTYSVVAKSASGKVSPAKEITLSYSLPAEYVAPKLITSEFDAETGKVDLAWSNDAVALCHHGDPKYLVSFDEDLDIAYGAKFSADELSEVAGYQIYEISFVPGAALTKNNLEIYAGSDLLWSYDISSYEPGYIYTLQLTSSVIIPEGKNIYLAYNAAVPAGTSAFVVDAGPGVDGGAVLSYNNGANWLAASALDADMANYNFCISAKARPAAAEAPAVTLGADGVKPAIAGAVTMHASSYGIEAAAPAATAAPRRAAIKAHEVTSFRVYRNGEVVAETSATAFSEVLKRYGEFNYAVTNVYANGWESPKSAEFYVANHTPQLPEAPYNLRGEAVDGTLNLSWEAIDAEAAVLKYHNGTYAYALGMTSSYNEGYHTILFTSDSIATMNKAGEKLTHIKFHLSSTEVDYAAAIVMVGNNVMLEQSIDPADLIVGWNVVRLDQPFTIPAGCDVKIGHHLKYAKGIKPLSTDDGPAVAGFGDLISASTSTWYSLASKYSLDYNFLIEGICQSKAQVLAAPARGEAEDSDAAATTTYSVYCNGTLVASGITGQSYSIASAADGAYTVTATTDGTESAHSNEVNYTAGESGINGIAVALRARYDRATGTVILPAATSAKVYNAAGSLVMTATSTDRIDITSLPAGAYIVVTPSTTLKVVK